MFAALLLAVVPSAALQPVPGAPCICFPIQHAGDPALTEKQKAGSKPEQLVAETLRVVRGSDDVFLRAEALRTTLQSLGHRSESKAPDESQSARKMLFDELSGDLKLATELTPMSRAKITLEKELRSTGERLAVLPGVARIEATSKELLTVWFDARQLSAESLREKLPAGVASTIEAPTRAGRASAAITLAFAGQASTQLGYRVDFDAPALARQATEWMPKDARVLILAAMVWADAGSSNCAIFARDALRCAKNDEYAQKNLVRILGAFFDADTLEALETKLDSRIQRG